MRTHKRIVFNWLGLALAAVYMSACADRPVEEVDVPSDVFTLEDDAMAVVPTHTAGTVATTTIALDGLRQKFGGFEEVYLLHHTSDSVIELGYQWQDTAIAAELTGGETYVIVPRRPGRFAATYDALCLLDLERSFIERVAPDFYERLCPVILCAAQPLRASALVDEFPNPYRAGERVDFGSAEIGGWGPGSDICARCPGFGDRDLVIPSGLCFDRPRPAPDDDDCVTYVFRDEFEADAVGGPPSIAPAGPPPDDALSLATPGNIRVILSSPLSSKAAIIRRGSTATTQMTCITGAAADTTGSYLVSFKGYSQLEQPNTPAVTVRLESSTSQEAFRLTIDNGDYSLLSGAGSEVLVTGYAPGVPDQMEFQLDLDANRFSLDINGTTVAADRPFIDGGFMEIKRLAFQHAPPTVEAFSAVYVVDEIKICKT